MDDQTPEMERASGEMRELMRLWIANPDNQALKRRYEDAQARYQRMYETYKEAQRAGPVPTGPRDAHEI